MHGRARPTTRPPTWPGSSAGCARRSPTSTCSSSTTARPTAPARSPTELAAADPAVRVVHRTAQGRPRRGVPARLPGGARRRLRRDRRDGRRRLPPARAAAPAARRARRRRPRDRLALGPRRLGRQLAAAAARLLSRGGNLYVRLLLGIDVRDATAGYRLFRRADAGEDRPRRPSSRPATSSRPTWPPAPSGRADRARGADRVRRAGARRLQDERRGRHRVAASRITAWGLRERGRQVRALARPRRPAMSRRLTRAGSAAGRRCFIGVPLLEIYVLIQVGQVIGPWWTILLLVARQHARHLADPARGRPGLAGAERGARDRADAGPRARRRGADPGRRHADADARASSPTRSGSC